MSVRVSAACAVAVVGLGLAAVAITAVTDDADTFAVVGLPFALVGALLLFRRVGHRIAWVLSTIGVLVCTGSTSAIVATAQVEAGRAPDGITVALAWYGEWYWLPFLYLALAGLPVLLPTGTLHSVAARRLWRVTIACMVVATASAMLQGDLLADDVATPIPNPVGVLPYDDVDHTPFVFVIVSVVIVLAVLAVAGVVRRHRRASGVERQQLKVVTFGAVASVAGFVLNIVLQAVTGESAPMWVTTIVVGFVPAAILVAILRYRLFEIDRLMSRTVTYAVVSAVLVMVYSAITVVPSAAFDLQSDLLVAAATLTAAAVFVPVRVRVQAAVDQRFNRARYDAALVVEQFASRLRHDVDLGALVHDLGGTVATTMQPAHVSLWLPGRQLVR